MRIMQYMYGRYLAPYEKEIRSVATQSKIGQDSVDFQFQQIKDAEKYNKLIFSSQRPNLSGLVIMDINSRRTDEVLKFFATQTPSYSLMPTIILVSDNAEQIMTEYADVLKGYKDRNQLIRIVTLDNLIKTYKDVLTLIISNDFDFDVITGDIDSLEIIEDELFGSQTMTFTKKNFDPVKEGISTSSFVQKEFDQSESADILSDFSEDTVEEVQDQTISQTLTTEPVQEISIEVPAKVQETIQYIQDVQDVQDVQDEDNGDNEDIIHEVNPEVDKNTSMKVQYEAVESSCTNTKPSNQDTAIKSSQDATNSTNVIFSSFLGLLDINVVSASKTTANDLLLSTISRDNLNNPVFIYDLYNGLSYIILPESNGQSVQVITIKTTEEATTELNKIMSQHKLDIQSMTKYLVLQ